MQAVIASLIATTKKQETNGREHMMKWIVALAATLAFTAQASAADKVVLMLNWYVYGEHAPF